MPFANLTIMKRNLLLSGLLSLLAFGMQAQEIYFDEPKALNESVNSSAEESKPLISPDGSTLYFVRSFSEQNEGGERGGQDIWIARMNEEGALSNVNNQLGVLNNEENNAVVGISESGGHIYVINSYTPQRNRRQGISFSSWSDNTWSNPEELDVEVKISKDYYDFYMTPQEDVLLISMSDDRTVGDQDLYVALKGADGNWAKAIHLGSVINTTGFEVSPYLAADGKTLYFASDGHGGEGDSDIFRSTRLDDTWTSWSAPENLGPQINSPKFDAYFYMGNDSTVYFASNRDGELSDIYTSKLNCKKEPVLADAKKEEVVEEKPKEDTKPKEEVVEQPRKAPAPITIYFAFDEATVSQAAGRQLMEVVDQLKNIYELKISIVGHADSQGSEGYNQTLSKERAEAVRTWLSQRDIDASRISISFEGESTPAASNDTKDGRSKNRRAVVSFAFPDPKKP